VNEFDPEKLKIGLAGFLSTRFVLAVLGIVAVVALVLWAGLDVSAASGAIGLIVAAYLGARSYRGSSSAQAQLAQEQAGAVLAFIASVVIPRLFELAGKPSGVPATPQAPPNVAGHERLDPGEETLQ
jgi:membrane protein implicated in regulation of membrane protease activity